jgi:tryptophan halogenase
MAQPVKSILIVGGGTAGWMAATYLATQLRATGGRVTLIEAPAIPIIGVGEATVPPLVGFLRVLGISEDEFMRRSHATYKLGIKFMNWHDGGHSGDDSYWHPFGPVGGSIDGLPMFHYWLKSLRGGYPEGPYTSYSLQSLLGEQEKAPRAASGSTLIYDRGQYAYHLDAGAFAGFLKDEAMKRGARHIADEVTQVAVDERGHIRSVTTKQHGALSADLYIDCSGFRALLAEQALGDPYIDWTDTLLCDRALAAPLPLGPRTPPYTRSTALSAGWVWQIPLTHRVGNGYVYSSKFLDEEAAGRELAGLLGVSLDVLQPRLLKMKVGRRTRSWQGNCIAMGLAAGFVEPLESTGIFVIQRALALLLTYFPDLGFEPHLARRFNERMAATYDEIRDFILAHYVLTRRDDSPFWNAYRNLALPDSLRELLEVYDRTGVIEPVEYAMFPAPSWYCILTGQRRLPLSYHRGADLSDFSQVRSILDGIRGAHDKLAASLPAHRAYIEMLNRGDPARRELHGEPTAHTAATGGIG